MSTTQNPDGDAQPAAVAVKLTAVLKAKPSLTVDEVLKLQELQELLDDRLPAREKKRLTVRTIYK